MSTAARSPGLRAATARFTMALPKAFTNDRGISLGGAALFLETRFGKQCKFTRKF
jgi:hypothetical protein